MGESFLANNRELFTNVWAGRWSSRFMAKGDRLWKLKEIVIFTLNLKGEGLHNPKTIH
jgi:hypothetical protein